MNPLTADLGGAGMRGYDIDIVWWDESQAWLIDFAGYRRRSAMRTAYRAKTKHRRRNR